MSEGRVIPVEIMGQRYPINTALEPEYVERLAAVVDEKMRAAANLTPNGESLQLAVLAALNIADELLRCRDASRPASSDRIAERAEELERSARPGVDGRLSRSTSAPCTMHLNELRSFSVWVPCFARDGGRLV